MALRFNVYRLLASVSLVLAGVCSIGCSTRSSHIEPQSIDTRAALRHFQAPERDQTPKAQWNTRPDGELAPGFEVEIRRAADPKINGRYRIGPDGKLALPYDVSVDTASMRPEDLKQALEREYGRILRNPNFELKVTDQQYYVDVRGLVQKPGSYLVSKDSSLDEVLSAAGGLQEGRDESNNPRFARIRQLGVTNVVRLRDYFSGARELIPQWQGGETVFISSEAGPRTSFQNQQGRNYVKVLGQVRTPGEYPFESSAGLFDYLIEAGGPTDRADLRRVALVRGVDGESRQVTIDLQNGADSPQLVPGDAIIVHANNPSELEEQSRIMGSFAGVLAALATVGLVIVAL